jgi:hypothetical protein
MSTSASSLSGRPPLSRGCPAGVSGKPGPSRPLPSGPPNQNPDRPGCPGTIMRRATDRHKLFEQSELQCAGRVLPNEPTAPRECAGWPWSGLRNHGASQTVVPKTRPQPPRRPDHGVAGRERKLLEQYALRLLKRGRKTNPNPASHAIVTIGSGRTAVGMAGVWSSGPRPPVGAESGSHRAPRDDRAQGRGSPQALWTIRVAVCRKRIPERTHRGPWTQFLGRPRKTERSHRCHFGSR